MQTKLYPILPGVLVVLLFTLISQSINQLAWVSSLGLGALTVAIILGMVLGSFYPFVQQPKLATGIAFCKGELLRLGIILYGFRLSLQQVEALGSAAIISDLVILSSTFILCYSLGILWLKLSPANAALIGAGSSICGAAAVVATGASIKASPEQQASAISTVVVFGTLSLFLYPLMYQLNVWGLSEQAFALYIGSSVHEVAQVVAAGSAISPAAAETAITTKMLRVMMLAPFLFILIRCLPVAKQQEQGGKLPIPWFAFIFIAVVIFNSFLPLSENIISMINQLDDYLLAMAMFGLGLSSSLAAIRSAGAKPFILAGVAFVWLILVGGLLQLGLS